MRIGEGGGTVSEIFLSWSTPDVTLVDYIVARLADVGIHVNEYRQEVPGGGEIRPWIVDSINRAQVVVAILSKQALQHSKWVHEELTLAAGRLNDPDNPLRQLIPVRVGAIPDRQIPVMLQRDRLRFLDVAPKPTESELELLINELTKALGRERPFVIPAAIFAMTSDEFAKFSDPGDEHGALPRTRLTALCQRSGMPLADLWEQLGRRYGATAGEFTPYADQGDNARRLVDVTQVALRAVNEKRASIRQRPLFLKWYSRGDFNQPGLRDGWRRGHSLLIVDSLSALDPVIAGELEQLPRPRHEQKAAVIYLPPYTRHSVQLENMIRECLEGHSFLSDVFRDWQDGNEPPGLAFDLPTGTSLRRWLDQFLQTLGTALEPDAGNVSKMQGDQPPRLLHRPSGMPGSRP
jgi:hypothetical protein